MANENKQNTFEKVSTIDSDQYIQIFSKKGKAVIISAEDFISELGLSGGGSGDYLPLAGGVMDESAEIRWGAEDGDPNTHVYMYGSTEDTIVEWYLETGKGNGDDYSQNHIDMINSLTQAYVAIDSNYNIAADGNKRALFTIDGKNEEISFNITDQTFDYNFLTLGAGNTILQDNTPEGLVTMTTANHGISIYEPDGINIRSFNLINLGSDDVFIRFNSGGFVLYDTSFNKGMEYAGDYSANFTNNSLVSKKYVDDAIAAAIP